MAFSGDGLALAVCSLNVLLLYDTRALMAGHTAAAAQVRSCRLR